jgi:hypothetical protein
LRVRCCTPLGVGGRGQASFYRLESWTGDACNHGPIIYCAYLRKRDPIIALFCMFERVVGDGDEDVLQLCFKDHTVQVETAWSLGKQLLRDYADMTKFLLMGLQIAELDDAPWATALARVRLVGDLPERRHEMPVKRAVAVSAAEEKADIAKLKRAMVRCFDKLSKHLEPSFIQLWQSS